MLCVPVRFEMSCWTSLGNSNILKRKIKKKEKEKKSPNLYSVPCTSPVRFLYGCIICAIYSCLCW